MARLRILCLVLLAVLVGLSAGCSRDSNQSMLSATGTVESTEIKVVAEVGGVLVEQLVEEGAVVEEGQELARLDAQSHLIQLEQAGAGADAAAALLAEAKAGARGQEIEAARLEAQRLARQADAVEAELALAEDFLGRFRELNQQGAVSDQELAQRETTHQVLDNQLASARAAAEAAQARVRLLEEGARAEQVERLAAQQRQAASGLDAARLSLAKTLLTAPAGGTVLSLNYAPGELVRPGAEVVTLQNNSRLWIYTYIPQESLGEVSLGNQVEVRADAYPSDSFMGKVTYIAPRAEFTPRNVHTSEERAKMVFKVKVELEGEQDKLRPGMTAEVFFAGS